MQVADKNREARGMAALALLCAVLELALAPQLGISGGRANFAFVFSACLALTTGGRTAVIGGFLAGLFFDLSTTGPVGLMAFCLTLSSFLLGREERNRLAGDLPGALLAAAPHALGVSLVYSLAMLLVGQTDSLVDALCFRALPTTLLTLLAFLPFAWALSRTSAGPSSGLSGGHFSSRPKRGL